MLNPKDDPNRISAGAYYYVHNLIEYGLRLTEEEEAKLYIMEEKEKKPELFTQREYEVIKLIKKGYNPLTIANELGCKPESFRICCHKLYKKLGIKRAPQGDKFNTLRKHLLKKNIG